MRPLAFALASSLSLALLYACSDDDGAKAVATSDAGSSGSSGSSGGPSAEDSGPPACTPIPQAGASVDVKVAKPPKPEATGGAPMDGTFVLKSVRAFTEIFPEGNTLQTFGSYTLVLGANATTFEQVVTDRDGEVTRAKGKLVVDGVNFTATPDCEAPLPDAGVTVLQGQYTSEGTTLKMYVVRQLNITAELLFEKQP